MNSETYPSKTLARVLCLHYWTCGNSWPLGRHHLKPGQRGDAGCWPLSFPLEGPLGTLGGEGGPWTDKGSYHAWRRWTTSLYLGTLIFFLWKMKEQLFGDN